MVVLSGRPATSQYVMDIPATGIRDLESLYTPQSADRLAILRHQIQVAQGREPAQQEAAE